MSRHTQARSTLIRRDKKRGSRVYRNLKRFGRRKQRLSERLHEPKLPQGRGSIEKRPAVVARRSRLGDYEADLIIGHKQSGNIVVLNDRKSRVVALRHSNTKRVDEMRPQLEAALELLGPGHTLTVDNGTELNGQKDLTKNTGPRVYFCHPYCSTERGTPLASRRPLALALLGLAETVAVAPRSSRSPTCASVDRRG